MVSRFYYTRVKWKGLRHSYQTITQNHRLFINVENSNKKTKIPWNSTTSRSFYRHTDILYKSRITKFSFCGILKNNNFKHLLREFLHRRNGYTPLVIKGCSQLLGKTTVTLLLWISSKLNNTCTIGNGRNWVGWNYM